LELILRKEGYMKKYMTVTHIFASIENNKEFSQSIIDNIRYIQDQQQIVEIQYAHSKNTFSALILGYIIEEENVIEKIIK